MIRPLLGPASCRYMISCTDFATQELMHKPLLAAVCSVARRVLACNPICAWLYRRKKQQSNT